MAEEAGKSKAGRCPRLPILNAPAVGERNSLEGGRRLRTTDSRPRDPLSTRLLLLVILVLATSVRLYGIHFSLWLDEAAALVFAQQPLGHLWGEWMLRETNPPLFYTLLKGWQLLLGTADAVVRLLPILIGLAGIWGMFFLGRAVGGARAGLLAAGLLALSAMHVDYSLQLRGYGLAHTAVVVACLGMVRFLQHRRPTWLLLYGAASWAALHCHTTLALFVALANAAMILLLRADRPALIRWLAANLLVAIAWSWWAWITVRQLGLAHNFGWITTPNIADAWRMTGITLGPLYQQGDTLAGGLLVLGMLGGSAWFAWRSGRPETMLLAILAFAAPLVLFAISQQTPIFLPRTLFWANAPLIALVAAAVTSIANRWMAVLLAMIMLTLSAVGTAAWYRGGEQEQWRAAAAVLDREAPDRDIWVADDAVALALAHYLPDASRRVVVVDRPGAPHERWAVGLFPGRHLGAREAAALFRQQCPVVGVSRGEYDPSPALATAGGTATAIGSRTRNPLVARWDCERAPVAR